MKPLNPLARPFKSHPPRRPEPEILSEPETLLDEEARAPQTPREFQAALGPWGRQAIQHWRRWRPKMFQALLLAGRQWEAAWRQEQAAKQAMGELLDAGFQWEEAWERVAPEYLLFPDEAAQPRLGNVVEALAEAPENPPRPSQA